MEKPREVKKTMGMGLQRSGKTEGVGQGMRRGRQVVRQVQQVQVGLGKQDMGCCHERHGVPQGVVWVVAGVGMGFHQKWHRCCC